jgi:hypothetical protein
MQQSLFGAPAVVGQVTVGDQTYGVLYESDTLHETAQTGKRKYWKVYAALATDGTAVTVTSYWQDGSVVQFSAPKIITPKNVGRANETRPADQAVSEAKALCKKQQDKGYMLPGQQKSGRVLAMLAKNYRDDGHRLKWEDGVDLQRKLDGVRLTTDGDKFYTREGREPVDPRIVEHLRFDPAEIGLPRGVPLDGEVMLPDFAPLEETVEAYKKWRPEVSPKLNFHRFDVCLPGMPWRERREILNGLALLPQHFLVETIVRVPSAEAAMELHHQFVDEGWEGTIFRSWDLDYQPGKRPAGLQKYKNFQEKEYKIIGYKEGTGKFKGTPIWRCIDLDLLDAILREGGNPADAEFDVTPRGSLPKRAQDFLVADTFIDKLLTTRFEILTKYGVPRNPRGVSVRDYE